VTAVVQVAAEMVGWKKMCHLYVYVGRFELICQNGEGGKRTGLVPNQWGFQIAEVALSMASAIG
jgi:hypothetical protein